MSEDQPVNNNDNLGSDAFFQKVDKILAFIGRLKQLSPYQRFNFFIGLGIAVCDTVASRFLWKNWLLVGIAWAVGFILFAFLYRRVPKPGPRLPGEIRGMAPYPETAGELFSRLGRQGKIRECENFLLGSRVVGLLHGQSGSGKTSLLRAGVEYRLNHPTAAPAQEPIASLPPVYWSLVAENGPRALTQAITQKTGIPLNDLSDVLKSIQGRLVILIDQFERISWQAPENQPIFEFIRAAAGQSGPCNVKLLIALQSDYLSDWLTLETETAISAQRIALGSFEIGPAMDVMQEILDYANVQVEKEAIEHYIRDMADNGPVSPVAIALGTMAFYFWTQASPGVPLKDYATLGAEAVLDIHVRDRLGPAYVRATERELFLGALLSLLVEGGNRSRPEGATAEEIARAAQLQIKRVQTSLNGLEDGRILEFSPSTRRYVIAHDRLVPILMKQDQGLSDFEKSIIEQYLAWKAKKNKHRLWEVWKTKNKYLLRGTELRRLLLVPNTFVGGPDAVERAEYLKLSKRARKTRFYTRLIVMALLGILGLAGWSYQKQSALRASAAAKESALRASAAASKLAPEMYEIQSSLELLELDKSTIANTDWLYSSSISDLSITSPQLKSLRNLSDRTGLTSLTIDFINVPTDMAGLSKLSGLQRLTLKRLGPAEKFNLDLSSFHELKELSLYLDHAKLTSIPGMKGLSDLQSLYLDITYAPITDLSPLAELNISKLHLYLDGSSVHDLKPLAKLKNLKCLILSLDKSQLAALSDLQGSKSRFELTLLTPLVQPIDVPDLSALHLGRLNLQLRGSQIGKLPNLLQNTGLHDLTLSLKGADTKALPDIGQLNGLTALDLNLQQSAVQSLPDLQHLQSLERLTLNLNYTGITELPDFSKLGSLKELNLSLAGDRIHSLGNIEQAHRLQMLFLDIRGIHLQDLRGAPLQDLEKIGQSNTIEKLTIRLKWSQINDLPKLAAMLKLDRLELDVEEYWEIEQLPDLSDLHLVEITLDLPNTTMMRLPRLPAQAEKVTLLLAGSDIVDVSSLVDVKGLTHLTLNIRQGSVKDLPNLKQLEHLAQVKAETGCPNISQLGNLPKLEELTTDSNCSSLQGVPLTVKRLHMVSIRPLEECGGDPSRDKACGYCSM
jgi:hypothetical protein